MPQNVNDELKALHDSVAEAETAAAANLLAVKRMHASADSMLLLLQGVDLHASQASVQPSTTAGQVTQQPTAPPVVEPTPKPSIGPVSVAFPSPLTSYTVSHVIGTTFTNKEDEGGETPASPDDPPTPTAYGVKIHYKDGLRFKGFALPFHCAATDTLDVTYELTGKTLYGLTRLDIGPWATNVNFFVNQTRPYAESLKGQRVSWNRSTKEWEADPNGKRTCNGAGVDFPPGVWSFFLGIPADEVYNQSPSGLFTLTFHSVSSTPLVHDQASPLTATSVPIPMSHGAPYTPAEYVARMKAATSVGVHYRIGWGGKSDHHQLPGDVDESDNQRYSDCSAFTDWGKGFDRNVSGYNTDAIVADAEGPNKHFNHISDPKLSVPGDDYVFGAGSTHKYGHTGCIVAVGPNGPTRVIDCSSANGSNAIVEKDPAVFLRNDAIIVRYKGFAT